MTEAVADAFPHAAIGARIGVVENEVPSAWFAKLVALYLRRRTPSAVPHAHSERAPSERARAAIKRAAMRSALTGGSSGTMSTAAAFVTASTNGPGGLVAIPLAMGAIAGELVLRTLIHVDLICDLADIFEIRFDPDQPEDIWRLCALAFRTHDNEAGPKDPGRKLVHELTHVDAEEIGKKIGSKLLGESVARNIVPILGIATSAYTNYRVTQRLGDTARRYMRYRRALDEALEAVTKECPEHLELLIEGMWFVFIADGVLAPEESACLASFLRRLQSEPRHLVIHRFVEDDYDWLERLPEALPPHSRPSFFHALEVATAVDKSVGVPERRLLRSAARRLGVVFDPSRLDAMVKDFEMRGVLQNGSAPPSMR